MSNVESFTALLAADPTMQRAFDELADRLIGDSKHPLTKDQCKQLTSVRLATLTQSDVDQAQYQAELADNFEVFRRDNEEAQQIQILMDKNIAEAEEAEAALGLADMSGSDRLAYARANGLISSKTEPAKPAEYSAEDKAALVAQASKMGPARRAAFARQHGLL